MIAIILHLVLLFSYIQFIQPIPIQKRGSKSGEGTFYKIGMGSCGQQHSDDEMVAAIHDGGQHCGQTISVHGDGGSVDVVIVDTCPGCADGDVDLSEAAFTKLASLDKGRIPITWSI